MQGIYFVVSPGPRPPFGDVARHLWGDADIDSDGNSSSPTDSGWTELTVALRPACEERVDIDPVSVDPLVLKVQSTRAELAERAARFLVLQTHGILANEWSGA